MRNKDTHLLGQRKRYLYSLRRNACFQIVDKLRRLRQFLYGESPKSNVSPIAPWMNNGIRFDNKDNVYYFLFLNFPGLIKRMYTLTQMLPIIANGDWLLKTKRPFNTHWFSHPMWRAKLSRVLEYRVSFRISFVCIVLKNWKYEREWNW